MGVNKRDLLKGIGEGTAAISSIPIISAKSYKSDEQLEKLAVSQARNKTNNLLAFNALEDRTLCLFLATGTSSADDSGEKIIQLTEPSDGSIWDIHWENPSTLSIWKNGRIIHLTVTPDGKVQNEKYIKDQVAPSEITTTPSHRDGPSTDMIKKPPTSGGDGYPDWFYDPEYESDPLQKCESPTNLGFDMVELCIESNSISPKVYTKSCTGVEQPLVGFSMIYVSITTPTGGGSASLDIWTGMDPDTGCIYIGSESGDFCVSDCFPLDPLPTIADLEEAFSDDIINMLEFSEDELKDIADIPWGQHGQKVVEIGGAVLIAILLAVLGALSPIAS
ncbi:hypothetical protein Halru_1839 [Halovivax ruber XH-70]|uniref:Uncharacterized protein n=1 Tax=Halovivax ruber (strain DSM 18193 / JCM 13892 / XH-70) TaxID=797302 RepID=L0IC88_HALRX|nr:hypothetical protein [Halovivax ruber]AGB16438.1 hypothetical protein Halru_1839 [Halovivax ruber XH-70]